MIDRVQLREIDWVLIGLLLVNSVIGILLIYSSSQYQAGNFYLRQAIWLVISLGALFLVLSIDYKILVGFSPYIYVLFILLLIGLLVFGRVISGAKSWIRLAVFGGQPSELAKVVVLLVLARIFAEFRRTYVSLEFGLLSGAVVFAPMAVVALQPDLGTAISFLPLLLASLVLAGMNRKMLALLLIITFLAGFAGWNYFLKDYQKQRLTTLMNPGQDPRGSGYHVLQSKIAIGSGGLAGKGFKKGSQSQLRFLPARHTDFIFSVLGEEFGFVGVFFVFLSYFFFLARIFRSVGKSRDRAGMYIVFMTACLLSFQFLINVMMIVGLFPITGVPIPMLSYGGSSLLTTFIAVGLVVNVKMRRFVNV
ncbi:MAG: rod shape-determining protein RodA [Candidatus Aminicenantes bacterium]|nr:rod shape-determining protein RodA [Candidatus Aminicenantes bacterium]